MKKILLSVSVLLVIAFVPLAFAGCGGTTTDGINLSNIDYKSTRVTAQFPGQEPYDFTFSCTVKNTTKETLQFDITYSARFGGVLGSISSEVQTIVLEPREKQDLSYTRYNTGEQVYTKSITISNVVPYEA